MPKHRQCLTLSWMLLVAGGLFLVPAAAQDDRGSNPPESTVKRPDNANLPPRDWRRPEAARPPQEPISDERRRELRQFVKENVPELERTLTALYQRNPQQFQRVLSSVNDSYTRLQNIKESGNEASYTQALENWKIDASIRMVMAQLAVRNQPNLEKRLNRLIAKQVDSRIEMMRAEKARLQARLATLETNLVKLESERDDEVKRRAESMLRNSEKVRAQIQATRKQGNSVNRPERKGEGSAVQPKRPNRQLNPSDRPNQNARPNQNLRPDQNPKPNPSDANEDRRQRRQPGAGRPNGTDGTEGTGGSDRQPGPGR